MKFLGSARALVFAVAVVTEVAGLGLTVLPALAAPAPPPGSHPDITITAGGDRTSSNAVSGTAGVRFSVPNASPDDCTTAAGGTCTVTSLAGSRRTITQESAPAGWFTSPQLAISPNSSTSSVAVRDYSALTTNVPQSGVDVPASTSGTTTNPTARSGVWAVSRQEPVIPPHCGLNVALLFDLSFSVQGHLRQVQDAGIGYVNALAGTPSSVALYTMGTHAPVNSTNNSNYPLTPVTTSANVAALTNKIRGYTVLTNPAQYTNLDQGLWQIASAAGPPGGTRVHYDAVIVISDGDPSVYGPTGIGQTFTSLTRFIDIENAIFSANALKAEDTKVISVGVNSSSATTLNLRAISGRVEGSDYFVTNTGDLEEILHDLALTNCAGSVNVTSLVIPLNSADISKAVPAPGWTLHATGATVSPAEAVTNETGASSFTTSAVTEPVNVTEEVMSGHQHVRVNSKNAVCTNLEGNPVPVTNTSTSTGPGFTVTTQANDVITCKIYNQQLAPSVVTTKLSATGGETPVGGSTTDSATLHDVTGTAGGTVEYRYYGSQAACQSATAASPPAGGTLVSTRTVTNGAVPPSAAATFPAAGTFYWAAFYSGDASNQAAASDCATEPLVVALARSQLTTEVSASGGEIPVGGSSRDTAMLHGVTPTAGGTMEYRYYDSLTSCQSATLAFPPAGGGTPVSTEAVTNDVVPPSAVVTFPDAGTFYWAAFYSGDPSTQADASHCATEPLVVTQAISRVTTALSAASGEIPVRGSAHDTATLHDVTPTAIGTVEFRYYDSLAACDSDVAAFPATAPAGGARVSTETVTNGAAPPSATATFPTAGTFYWAAFYSGGPNNLPSASDCATEPLVVSPAPSRLTTRLSAAGGQTPVGGSAHDTATLQGVTPTAAGTVQFRYYDSLAACDSDVATFPGTAPAGGAAASTETVADGVVPPSSTVTFPDAGTFYWAAFYSGGPNNLPSASDCATEPLVVTPAASQVTTKLSATDGEITVGGTASDTATLSGVTSDAGGTVDYRYYDSLTACDGDVATFPRAPAGGTDVSTETVTNGAAPPSSAVAFTAAGTFYWAAFYSGDANNLPVASDCAAEPLVVTSAPSDVTTRLSAANGQIAIGAAASDSATLNAVTPTAGGTVDYRYYDSLSACDTDVAAFPGTAPSGGTPVSTQTVTNGAAPSSAARTFPDAGTFYWAAFYSGDPSNQADASNCAAEPLVVTPAQSQVTTVLSVVGGKIPVEGSASDAATLNGVTGTAGGTVEYRLYGSPSVCDGDVAAFPDTAPSGGTLVSTVTVTNGAAPSSAARTFGAAGTFYWAAFYSGDANNRAVTSDCTTEPLVVTPAQSQVTTQLSATDGQTPVGGSVSDAATLHDVTGTAGGTVDYRYYDSQAACETDVAAFPGAAPSGGTPVSTEAVTNGAVPRSSAVTFPDAGTVYWTAFYSGDIANLPVASDCATEPLVVTQAPSRVTTVLSVAGGQFGVGGSASDAATLIDVAGTAGGTVEYRYYDSQAACESDVAAFRRTAPSGGTPVSTETVTNGAVPPSAVRKFPIAGTFHWAAFYSGDLNNRAAASDCATEPLVVTPAQSRVTTDLSAADGEIPVGGSAGRRATQRR